MSTENTGKNAQNSQFTITKTKLRNLLQNHVVSGHNQFPLKSYAFIKHFKYSNRCLNPFQKNHTQANKSRHVTLATGHRPGHKQLLKTPASLNCIAAVGYPVWDEPLPQPTSLNLSYLSVHRVAFFDAPLVPKRLGTLTPALASTSTEGNSLFH